MRYATSRFVCWFAGALLIVTMLPLSLSAQSGSWMHTGGPVGGSTINSTFVAGDTIYVGSFSSGAWRSVDDGMSWTRLHGTFASASDFLITPYGRMIEANEDGIRYSDDGGETWTEIAFEREAKQLESGYGILAVHMNEASYEVHDSYIRVSTDSGKTWMQTHIDSAKGVENVGDIAIISDDSLLAATDKGVYSMTLEDTTWTQSALTNEVSSLAMAEGRIFTDGYKSTDMGASWDSLKSYPLKRTTDLIAAPTGDVYAARSTFDTLYHSPDFGGSWSVVPEENVARLDIRSKATNQQGDLYVGLFGTGLFRYSKDMGKWSLMGPPTTNVLDMYTRSNGNVLVGTEGSGLNTYMPSKGMWSKEYGPFENQAIGVIDSTGDRLIMSREGRYKGLASIYFSDDGGQTWTKQDSALMTDGFDDLTATAYVNHDAEGMFIGTLEGGIYNSMDGQQWNTVNDSVPSDIGAPYAKVNDMAMDQKGNIYASFSDPGLYQWNTSNSYWKKVTPSADTLLDATISSIAVHPNGAVIAGRWIRPAGSTSWDTLNMPDNNANYDVEVEVLEISDDGTIYLASWTGAVYKSGDMGQSWMTILSKLGGDDEGIFTDIAFSGDKVLFATESRGVYQWITSSTSIDPKEDELPNRITLKQNRPNPFNPTTKIKYSLPQATRVQFTVYDVLGRHVATLVDGRQQAGQHSVNFNAGNLSSGVYIYRLKTDGFSKSRKMLLVK